MNYNRHDTLQAIILLVVLLAIAYAGAQLMMAITRA
jgi:hypothetical protein